MGMFDEECVRRGEEGGKKE